MQPHSRRPLPTGDSRGPQAAQFESQGIDPERTPVVVGLLVGDGGALSAEISFRVLRAVERVVCHLDGSLRAWPTCASIVHQAHNPLPHPIIECHMVSLRDDRGVYENVNTSPGSFGSPSVEWVTSQRRRWAIACDNV